MVKKHDFSVDISQIPKMPIKDWLLLILHDKEEKIPRDSVTLMNQTFIFAKEVFPSIEEKFEFKRTGYGPYSEKVAKAVNELFSNNMLEIQEGKIPAAKKPSYILTEKGVKEADKLISKFPEEPREKMQFMNLAAIHMGTFGMIQYIHSIYPEHVYLREGGAIIA